MKTKYSRGTALRRLLAMLLAALISVTAFAGCSSGKQQPGSQPDQSTAEVSEEQTAEDAELQQEPEDEREPSDARPLIWAVTAPQGEEAVMYLFGSIHAANPDLYPLHSGIMDAFASCDSLAVEADIDAMMSDPDMLNQLMPYLVYGDGRVITDEIDPELVKRALKIFEQEEPSLTGETLMLFRPYMWTAMLQEIYLAKSELQVEAGVDLYFLELAKQRGMPVLEVESIEFQMEMLTGFSPEVQSYLLESALQIDEAVVELDALYSAWYTGDEAALLFEEVEDAEHAEHAAAMAEYEQALVHDRNTNMANVAESYIAAGNKVFYVVGVLHMVGETGLVQQLTDRGYTVTRI
jgi:Uncharacterized protein conserved in bacteria